jgi:molecular chaperone DnaK (HSP70)
LPLLLENTAAMSVVGIDFGAQSTKIGVARNKGIDIVSVFIQESSLHQTC